MVARWTNDQSWPLPRGFRSPDSDGEGDLAFQPPPDQWLRDLLDPTADDHHPGTAQQEMLRRAANHSLEMQALVGIAYRIMENERRAAKMMQRMVSLMYPPIVARIVTAAANGGQNVTRIGDGIEMFVLDSVALVAVGSAAASDVTVSIQGMESEQFHLVTALPKVDLGITDFRERMLTITNNDATNTAGVLVKFRRLLRTEEP